MDGPGSPVRDSQKEGAGQNGSVGRGWVGLGAGRGWVGLGAGWGWVLGGAGWVWVLGRAG